MYKVPADYCGHLFYGGNSMSIIELLNKESTWNEFLQYKIDSGHLTKQEQKELVEYIKNKEYKPIVKGIIDKETFAIPTMKHINKKNSKKKRTVFLFDKKENFVFKALMFLLYKYDDIFSPNLYSFRRNISVKTAINNITVKDIKTMYGYKVDIHNYFNSVDVEIMTKILQNKIKDDELLVSFVSSIISEPKTYFNGEVITCKKGIMAGVPISGFLANLYLEELDKWFYERNILYARYSDDIIVFGETKKDINKYKEKIKQFLKERKLTVNESKEFEIEPNEKMDFLGFSFADDKVDLSDVALQKIKGKMKRKAKALLRWKTKNKASDERAIRAYIRHFNKKFFDNPKNNEITWCRWYFPIITTDASLHILDNYMVQNIRYIATGKYTKANYNLKYESIKEYGFKSLVHSYYNTKIQTEGETL